MTPLARTRIHVDVAVLGPDTDKAKFFA